MYSFLLTMTMLAAFEDAKVFSGPQVGEKLTSFKAVGVFDDQDGMEQDFIKQTAGKPTLLIFVHELTRPSAALMRSISAYADTRKRDGLQCCVVWLSADRTETAAFLKRAKMSINLKSQVMISTDGIEGPGGYGLNRKVALTILVAKDNKVTANYALVQPAMTDAPTIAAAVVKQIGGKAPDLQQMEEFAHGMRKPGERDPALVERLRQVIQKDASEEDVKKAVEAVEKYVGEDAAKKKQVIEIGEVVIKQQYGTEAAQKQFKAWIEKYKAK